MISVSKDDFGALSICALRYCQGRMTYMPELVIGICTAHIGEFSDKDLRVMYEDCMCRAEYDIYGDPVIDKPGWIRWQTAVEKEIERRKKS